MSTSEIVNKVWNYAHILRDDGVGYGNNIEQTIYLIFLKLAGEHPSVFPTLTGLAEKHYILSVAVRRLTELLLSQSCKKYIHKNYFSECTI